MTIEQVILIILQVTLFISALNLGFGATRFELSFLFRRPGLFARTFLAMYVVVPVVTAVILILVPLPVGVKTAVILLSISPIAITLPFKMEAMGANPAYAYSLLIGMSLLSVVTVPVSLTILTALPLAHDASVPPIEVVKIIAKTILIPLILGAIIRRFAPRWAERFSKPINAVIGKVTMASFVCFAGPEFEWYYGSRCIILHSDLCVGRGVIGSWTFVRRTPIWRSGSTGNGSLFTSNGDSYAHSGNKFPRCSNFGCDCDLPNCIYCRDDTLYEMVQETVGSTNEAMKEDLHYDLIVIGGGPAGQGAAEFAAFARQRILVIERKVLGGLVVTTGGGPTKTLREAALHLTGFRHRALYGQTAQPDIGIAVERTRARTREVSTAMQDSAHYLFVDSLGVDVVYGSARLGPNREVLVSPLEGTDNERIFTANRILIATGSFPFHPTNISFDDPDIFDSEGLPKT